MDHDFTSLLIKECTSDLQTVPVSYLGFDTDDDLVEIVGWSIHCVQDLEFTCSSSVDSIEWTSLTGESWSQTGTGTNCRYEIIEKK